MGREGSQFVELGVLGGSVQSLISVVLKTITRLSSSLWNNSSSSGFRCFFRDARFRSLWMQPAHILTSAPPSGRSSSPWLSSESLGDFELTSSPRALAKALSRFFLSWMALVHSTLARSSRISGDRLISGLARNFGLEMAWLGRRSFLTPGGIG